MNWNSRLVTLFMFIKSVKMGGSRELLCKREKSDYSPEVLLNPVNLRFIMHLFGVSFLSSLSIISNVLNEIKLNGTK